MARFTLTENALITPQVPGFARLDLLATITLPNVSDAYVYGDFRASGQAAYSVEFLGFGLTAANGRLSDGTITALKYTLSGIQVFYLDLLQLPVATFNAYIDSRDEAGFATYLFSGNDELYGTSRADLLTGYGGDDVIGGKDGNDTLAGGEGNDTLYGEADNDVLYGAGGADEVHGGTGNDFIYLGEGADNGFGEAGNDTIFGEGGNDIIAGGVENDYIDGGNGDDNLQGEAGNDTLRGGAGNDSISGGVEEDLVYGDAGNDSIYLDSGQDTAYGGTGDDTIFGDTGDDVLVGEDGDDQLFGGNGNDTILGGAGADQLFGGENLDLLYGDIGNDTLYGEGSFDTAGVSTLWRQNTLTGTVGNFTLTGPEGVDTLYSIESIRSLDGWLELDGGGPVSQVARLYLATLGRASDATGLGYYVAAIEAGTQTLNDISAGLVASAEFGARYGNPGNSDFVTLLYANVLNRAPDSGGLAYYVARLDAGEQRSTIVLDFSESDEFIYRAGYPGEGGIFAPDPVAVDVVRYYETVLDRLPDAGGAAYWIQLRHGGLSLANMGAAFTGSAEFESRYGALSNSGFVEQLYLNALDRAGDSGGIAYWTAELDHGALSRAGVADSFAFSAEMTAKVEPLVDGGITFA
ncbi:hemolysin type calcium-binding protein [Humitalea rosea]|uniref:Hemolysin type calcium-binding protein n=1 Tax=Humitalea rosea TaxID=990373 RepID=A0A2W7ISZ9_9PROT|nr:DUF4214 domain-containing protein [Humitalea rosea]PZW50324.1 hemolysin type calcium-binding protein [Humitalea rosea]